MSATTYPASNSPTVKAKRRPSLSHRLRTFRLSRDLTYRDLAELCGVNPATIMRACHSAKLTERIAYKIEKALSSAREARKAEKKLRSISGERKSA